MKKSICIYFQIHQPTRLRLYRFFEIGKDSHYFDDFANRTMIRRLAERCYLPANAMLLDMINESNGQFKVAFSISGSTIELFDRHCPEVLESFRKLAATGCVEFLAETYSHSLVSLASPAGFKVQVDLHRKTIEQYFGVTPTTFRNTELIYSDAIGAQVYDMGFKTMLTEGAKHVLGWRSPNYLYNGSQAPKLNLLLRNSSLSDDIAFRFSDRSWSNWPLTADKYLEWIKAAEGEIVNLFMDYEAIGEYHRAETGIMDFMKALSRMAIADGDLEFVTPAQAVRKHASAGEIDVPDAISWADEERDTSAWLGNELQQDAFNKLYSLIEKLAIVDDEQFWQEHSHLQESQNFYYMCTKFFTDGNARRNSNPYDTPYEAFINFMNALSDFTIRLDDAASTGVGNPGKKEDVVIVTPINRPGDKARKTAAAKKAPVKKAPAAKKAPAKKATAKK